MKKIKQNWPVLILSLILLIIYSINFIPGTYLMGWDNLMPELNIWMNIKRSLFAVWQEYQGLGLVGGMGHATDLIRQIILLPFTLILPNNWIRYLWTFGMLALGSFGVYFGVKKTSEASSRSGLIAALFYLLNFGTIQIFWVPFEAFTTFWGFFPWLIFSFLAVIRTTSEESADLTLPKRRSAWRNFIIWNILAVPSFYIQTLFVVYLICLGVISIVHLVISTNSATAEAWRNPFWKTKKRSLDKLEMTKEWKSQLERLIKAGGLIFLINSFWLLPFGYFLLTNAHHPREALINRMSTEETFLRNQRRGYLEDFLILKGYYYDFPDAQEVLMAPWQNHFSTPILIIGYGLGGIVILGLFKSTANFIHRPKSPEGHLGGVLVGLFLLSAVALLSATPPFSWLNYLIRQWPFLNQVFRSPFTKFIFPAGFSFGLLFSYGIDFIIQKIKLKNVIISLSIIGMIIFSWPVFRGNLVYSEMRQPIPEKYHQLFEYFKNQPKTGRIANLPQGNFWGWTFYRFGSRGSGFIWYGIEQPIMDRAFDVWNLKNERYYWELTYALQNQDLELLESILKKYSIEYLLFDDDIIFPEGKNWAKLALNTKELVEQAGFLKHAASFENIFVYKVKNSQTKPYLTDHQNNYVFLDQIPEYDLEEKPQFLLPKEEINLDQLVKIAEFNLGPNDFINPHICAPVNDQSTIDYQVDNDQMILNANETALCLEWNEYGYFQQFDTSKLIKMKFEYQSDTNEWPRFCLWDITNLECANRKDFPKEGFSQEWNTYSEEIIFNPDNQTISNLALIIDGHQKSDQKIKYRNVTLEIYDLPNGARLPMIIKNPIDKNLVQVEPKTCTDYQEGEYSLEFKSKEYLRLLSTDNNSCYTWAFNHLPLNQAWQIEIKYRNVQGYPLTIFASSIDGQYQMYQNILTDSKEWQTKYFLLPPYDTHQKGIQIQVHNNSFNYQPSVNDIGSIEIYPADIEYPTAEPPAKKIYLDSNSNIWRYKVKVNSGQSQSESDGPLDQNNYLVLPQAYDNGWMAFYFNGWRPRVLKDRVLINNWANGWNLNRIRSRSEEFHVPGSSAVIYIVFWPQILQFIGFGLLAGTIAFHLLKQNLSERSHT